MIRLYENGAYLIDGKTMIKDNEKLASVFPGNIPSKKEAAQNTMAYAILQAHNTANNMEELKIKFDAIASHDITYVGIIQTARASGLKEFPLPYILTNCHNSLCAVGGTINEDDHMFGLSAAKKYGGVYVPAHQAVIHQYMREMYAGCGKMILGSDSHTRYGALGTMAIGEGGPELVKQLLNMTYDIKRPEVVAVYLKGKLQPGVGPQDVALAIIGAVFQNGYVKNKVLEFVGEGVYTLSAEERIGIDVMTTETACLSSIWVTDHKVKEYLTQHHRAADYKELKPGKIAYYDGVVEVDLTKVKPMIALPFHPSNTYTIEEFNQNAADILHTVETAAKAQLGKIGETFHLTDKIVNGRLRIDQGVIAGCAGGLYENITAAADILQNQSVGNDAFTLSVYPASQPVFLSLLQNGAIEKLMTAGAVVKTAFCGPCFGAGDVPANNGLSIRHTTRNFPNREGSKPSSGQIASVALMDARSIAATARNKGILTPATEIDTTFSATKYFFNDTVYKNRVYDGYQHPQPQLPLQLGPNIADWPVMQPLHDHLLLKVASVIHDPVTTTDELIPSGETSSYRSNPNLLAEFTLSRKDPQYVGRAKAIRALEEMRLAGELPPEIAGVFEKLSNIAEATAQNTMIGSVIYAKKPGDGSAREQAASCQKVLGGMANIATEYATKRYRSNLINWGMLPLLYDGKEQFAIDEYIFIPNIKQAIENKENEIAAYLIGEEITPITFTLSDLTDDEREIILAGCLINYYKQRG